MSKASAWAELFMCLYWAHLDAIIEALPEISNSGGSWPRNFDELCDRNRAAVDLTIVALDTFGVEEGRDG